MPLQTLLPYVTSAMQSGAAAQQQDLARQQSMENTMMTIQGQRRLAEEAYQRDIDMWNRANEYNLPVNQVQRMKDAGLNPALLYKGSPQNTASGDLPKYQRYDTNYDVKPIDPTVMLSQFQDMSIKQAQIDIMKEQAKLEKEKVTTQMLMNNQIPVRTRGYGLQNIEREWITKGGTEYERLKWKELQNRVQMQEATIDNKEAATAWLNNRKYLLENGITTSDNIFFRTLLMYMKKNGIDINNFKFD